MAKRIDTYIKYENGVLEIFNDYVKGKFVVKADVIEIQEIDEHSEQFTIAFKPKEVVGWVKNDDYGDRE